MHSPGLLYRILIITILACDYITFARLKTHITLMVYYCASLHYCASFAFAPFLSYHNNEMRLLLPPRARLHQKLLGLEISTFVTIRCSEPVVKLTSLNRIVATAARSTKTRAVQYDHRYEHIPLLCDL